MATGRILIANAQTSGGVYGILNFNFTPLGGVQKNYNLSNYSGFNSDNYLDWYVDLNERHFWIKFKASGYFKPLTSIKNNLYIFAIGGGGAGRGAGWNNSAGIWSNGAGGSGGCIREGTFTIRYNDDPYLVTIGTGGTGVAGTTGNNGSSTIAFGITAPGGMGGSSSGAPWTYGYSAKTYNSDGKGGGGGGASDANAGQSGDDGEYAYGDSLLDGIKYGAGGGGGGGKNASGGSTGGGTGRPGVAGQANTGSGGGGFGGVGREGGSNPGYAGGAGGSGCVIIRNYTYL